MEIITPIIFLLAIVLTLTAILLLAKTFLVSAGKVKITINGDKIIEVDGGSTLLTTLGNEGIFLPSACGGGGTCVQCTCQVLTGGGSILPTEEPHSTHSSDHAITLDLMNETCTFQVHRQEEE